MEARRTRTRLNFPGGIKPFHARPPDLRPPLAEKFTQFAMSADFGLTTPSVVAKPLYTLYHRRNVTSTSGVPKWEYRGKYHNGNRRNGCPKLKTQAASTDCSSMFSMHGGIFTTHTCHKYSETPRENAHNSSPVKTRFDCFQ